MKIDNRDRLGALVSYALGQGWPIVQVEVGSHTAILRAGDPAGAIEVAIDLERLAASGANQMGYLVELMRKIGKVAAIEAPRVDSSGFATTAIETLAARYLVLAKVAKAADVARGALLRRMAEQGRTAIDVRGVGAVVYQPSTTRRELDRKAAVDMLFNLGSEPPMKSTRIGASLRVTWATETEEAREEPAADSCPCESGSAFGLCHGQPTI